MKAAYEIFKKELPSKFINTRFGKITYFDWLCKEEEKINQSPGRIAKIEGGDLRDGSRHREVCLLVNKIT